MKNIPQWLHNSVFYQIYPQSFYDSNNDGIGDLQGIIEKLGYVKELGCNAIWLNPCFESPFNDAGYDISDYYKVASRYGTNNDLKKLFSKAKKMGIRICLDLVAGHTSIEHPWFQESSRAEHNQYSNRYIWTSAIDDKDTGNLDWISGYGQRHGNYITNYYWCQPALNYGFAKPNPKKTWQLPVDHPDTIATRKELIRIMEFWLEMGCSGFRIDMADSLIKNDKTGSEIRKLWRDVFGTVKTEYPDAVFISEWGYHEKAIKAGFHIDMMLPWHNWPQYDSLFRMEPDRAITLKYYGYSGHSFFDRKGKGDITTFLDLYLDQYRKVRKRGYISIVSGNHDILRISIGRASKDLEVVFAFLMTMPGVPFIYYGDEIGMNYVELPCKEGGYRKTGSRTPMQWTDGKNAGFSKVSAKKLYLPISKGQKRINVKRQIERPKSLLNKVRQLIEIRKSSNALGSDGEFLPIYAEKKKYPFIYLRKTSKESFLIVINPADRPEKAVINLKLSKEIKYIFGGKLKITTKQNQTIINVDPVSYSIYKI